MEQRYNQYMEEDEEVRPHTHTHPYRNLSHNFDCFFITETDDNQSKYDLQLMLISTLFYQKPTMEFAPKVETQGFKICS